MKILRTKGWAVISGDPPDIDYDEHENDNACHEPDSASSGYFQQYRIYPSRKMAEASIRDGECYFVIRPVVIDCKEESG